MKKISVIEVMGSISTKYGGVEKFITRLIMENSSYKFYIVYDEKPWNDEFLEKLNQLGAVVLIIDTRGSSFITNSYKFYKLLRNVKPEIVHFHFSFAFCTWGPICKMMKVKHLYKTVHGCLFFNSKQACDIRDTSLKLRLITQWGNIYKIFDNIFCVSNFVKNQMDRVYKYKGNTNMVYLGTESPILISDNEKSELRRELGIVNQFVILTIAFANPIKGCDIFVKALSRIKHKNIVTLIVGMDESEAYTQEVMNIAKDLGVDSYIRWIGITDEVYKYMNIADAFVQSSRTEALSLAAVEALSYSMPVVATDTGGLPEVASELFPYEDYNKLAEILDKLIAHKKEYNELSEKSHNRWLRLFRIENGVKQYTKYYNKGDFCA